jgi:tetratricopeptide (TPR) repeat protein
MTPVRGFFAIVIILTISGRAIAQSDGAWFVTPYQLCTRDGFMRGGLTFARTGFHVNAVLGPGSAIQVCGISKGQVQLSMGGQIPLSELMTPVDAIAYFTQRIENSAYAWGAEIAYISRGNSYFAAQLYAEAISDYNAALRLEPRSAEALLRRGIVRERTGRVKLALADFDAAVKIKPRLAEAIYHRCALHARAERLETAFADLKAIAELDRHPYRELGYPPATWLDAAARILKQQFEASDHR